MATQTKKTKPAPAGTNQPRAFARVNLPGRVYIHDENQLFIAPLNNISAGGLFVDGLTSFPLGAAVKIVIKSPTLKHAIQAGGQVVRVETENRKGIAIQFDMITRDTQLIIQESVERCQAQAISARMAA